MGSMLSHLPPRQQDPQRPLSPPTPHPMQGKCACACRPNNGNYNGWSEEGCGTDYNNYCGTCKPCTNSQTAIYACT